MGLDNTWGMAQESIPFTTGQQMAILALNPDWKLGLNFVWGWDSGLLGNLAFYAVVGTTEPSRRHYDDVAWRSVVDSEGNYHLGTIYGLAPTARSPMSWRSMTGRRIGGAQQRYSLIYPEAPLGAGLIVSSNVVDAPDSVGFSGGGMGGSPSEAMTDRIAQLFERLHNAGLSIPFSSNIAAVSRWSGSAPLILQDLSAVTPAEVRKLAALGKRGVKIAAFAGSQPPAPDAAALFGLNASGAAGTAKPVGTAAGATLLAHGNFFYIPTPHRPSRRRARSSWLRFCISGWSCPLPTPTERWVTGFTSGKQNSSRLKTA